MSKQYLLITHVKNEEKNLPNLFKSILEQSIRPVQWVIIDDGSIDDTPTIIENIKKNNCWIKSIRMNSEKRDLGIHLSKILRSGFDFGINEIEKNNLNYEYIGNVDADVTLDPLYYENLIAEFLKDPELGVAGGGTWYHKGDTIKHYDARLDEPSGGNILIIKRCFEECNGIPITYAWDSVLKVKARLHGWKTKRFEHIISVDSRDINSAEGYWKGGYVNGKSDYFINKHYFHILLKSINMSRKKPYYMGVAYLMGYLSDLLGKNKKIDDEEVKKYNWNKWRDIVNEIII